MVKREIKFRAWSKKEKCFVKDFVIDRLGNEYQMNKCEFWGDERNVFLMQYTDLLDKNGVEIYEDDIVKLDASFTEYQDKIGVVKFMDGAFIVDFKGMDAISLTSDVTVLGNIHEHGELLK